ncbi:MAG: NAD(P)H-quinone oxidoreductase [Maricaulaceae bacterium]
MAKSQTMRAARAPDPGPPEAIRLETLALPIPGRGEVLIRVRAAGVNRPDCLQRQGLYPPPDGATDVLGLEVAGEIVGLGDAVPDDALGREVCALLPGGGYAEYAVAPYGQCLPIPNGLSAVEAAGLPETVFTVWANVFERGQLQPDETLLVHGGASGIGTTAIQLAKARGARVFATAGTEAKAALCRALGADLVVNYRDADFETAVMDAGGADVVLDMVGGAYTQKNLNVLKPDGRLVQIAFLEGAKVEINLASVMLKRLTLTGSTLRARSLEEKARLARAVKAAVWPWIADGRVKPVIDRVLPLDQAAEAHRAMEAGEHAGKIILTPT